MGQRRTFFLTVGISLVGIMLLLASAILIGALRPAAAAEAPQGVPRLSWALSELVAAQESKGAAAAISLAQSRDIAVTAGAVRVIVEAQGGQAQGVVAAAGGQVEATYKNLVQVSIPIAKLKSLAAADGVSLVRLPLRGIPSIVGEGVSLIRADAWQAAGYNGVGVKVAVLDTGFAGYTALLGTELPTNVITASYRMPQDITGGGDKHGTAVAETVYETAPGATLYLVNYGTEVEMGNAVDYLISQGVNVIVHAVGYIGAGPGDGTGFFADMLTSARNSGILWVQAAGNVARNHWSGTWANYATISNTEGGFSLFVDSSVNVANPQLMVVGLTWDDTWGSSTNDYDLYLYDNAGQLVASSKSCQRCTSPELRFPYPFEYVQVLIDRGGFAYKVKIDKVSAKEEPDFDLVSFYHEVMNHAVITRSLLQPADYATVMAVGAVPAITYTYVVAGTVYTATPNTIERFSSQGPIRGAAWIKPDIAGPDGVSGATYGSTPPTNAFFGTSASAGYVGGAAALVKQFCSGCTVSQIQRFLESRAVDLGAARKDNVFGAGRLNMGAPVTVVISVTLQGGTGPGTNRWIVPVTTTLTDGAITYTGVYTTSNTGVFTLTGIASGDGYTITVVSPHTLLNRKTGVAINSPTTAVDMCTLLEGDANMDGGVNMYDFNLLSASYLRRCGDSGFNEMTDFDRSCQVNMSDFGLLVGNYTRTGPVTCPP